MWDLEAILPLRDMLKSQLVLNFTPNTQNLSILKLIESSKNSCFLHIRRGDFVELEDYECIEVNYYTKAINLMRSKLGEVDFFIFGNDVDFMKKHFSQHIIVAINDESQVSCDFMLMRACKNAIIANSTLSSIVGFLCDGIVIYYKDSKPETPHLPHFIGIS